MQQRYTFFLMLLLSAGASCVLMGQGNNFKDYILKKEDNVQQKISRNIFIKVTVDKATCYVGEPLTVLYELYTRLGNMSSIIKNPAFNGFSVIDLSEPEIGSSSRTQVLDGREYNVSVIRKAQLYPLQAGICQLGPALLKSKLRFTRDEYITQFDENGKPEFIPGATTETACFDTTAMLENPPVSITVKPLPENNKPYSFNGAVGTYMIDALIEKDSFTTDDAGKLRILLSGEGNMTLVPAPEVAFPAGLEAYEPSVKDGLNRLVVPVSGSKIFDYTFTAAKAGDYQIPPITFSYFDIDSGRYKTISTKPVVVHIKKGTGKTPVIVADKINQTEDFGTTMFTHRWMIIVPVALLIIIGLGVWLWLDKKKQRERSIRAAQHPVEVEEAIIPVNPLAQTELMLMRNEPRLFYETIDKELHIFLSQKLKLPAERISKKNIAEALDQSGTEVGVGLAIQKLLDDISLQLYTPFADDSNMQDYYIEAVRLLKML